MKESGQKNEFAENGQHLVRELTEYSDELAHGSHDAIAGFMDLLTPEGQDPMPKYDASEELLDTLTKHERLAINLTKHFGDEYNRNFGFNSDTGVDLKNGNLQEYFRGVGIAVHSILVWRPNWHAGLASGLLIANEAYRGMIKDANQIADER